MSNGNYKQMGQSDSEFRQPVSYALQSDTRSDGSAIENELSKMEVDSQIEKSIMGRGLTFSRISSIASKAWSAKFPYTLRIVKMLDSNDSAGSDYKYATVSSYRFPINPQDLVISTPYANRLTITARGVNEEHNGAPIKMITINGTTGMKFNRATSDSASIPSSSVGTVFASTIGAFKVATSQLQSLKDQINGILKTDQGNPSTSVSEEYKQTGWYQHQVLRLFLDHYAELKKTHVDGPSYRLVLSIPKDGMDFLVTPGVHTTRRSASSPMEYNYTLQFTAWGTLQDIGGVNTSQQLMVETLSKNQLSTAQKVFNSIRQARQTVFAFKNIVSAAQSDVESNIIGPMNQTILLLKDILSIPASIADLPSSLSKSFTNSVVSNWNSLSRNPSGQFDPNMGFKVSEILSASTGTASPLNSSKGAAKDIADDFFTEFLAPGSAFAESITINDLQPGIAQQEAVNSLIDSARLINENYINTLIQSLQKLIASLESQISDKSPLEPEWALLYNLQDSIAALYEMISSGVMSNSNQERLNAENYSGLALNAIDFWQESAQSNDILFERPNSQFQIPFPFRSTLEEVAATYLNDPNRWIEIAALNNLQSPYIDEDGFTQKFLSTGSANQFNVDDINQLYTGQTIWIFSDNKPVSRREILAIQRINLNNYLITVDGADDLALYKFADNAQFKAYLPNTTNSLKKIWIPSDQPFNNDDIETKLTFRGENQDLVKFAKVDLLLDGNFDLAVTSDGFCNLAFGATNLIQASKIKMLTPAGSLILYPEFGAGVEVGDSTANVDLNDIIKRINDSYRQDPRFNIPASIALTMDGASILMNITASVAKDGSLLPITFPLTK